MDNNNQNYNNYYYGEANTYEVVTKKKNTIFVEENTPADTVYILVDGTIL